MRYLAIIEKSNGSGWHIRLCNTKSEAEEYINNNRHSGRTYILNTETDSIIKY